VLEVTCGRTPLAVEIKEPPVAATTAREIVDMRAEGWVTLWSFHSDALESALTHAPDLAVALLHRGKAEPAGRTIPEFLDHAAALGAIGVSFFPEDVTASVIEMAHERGLAVYSGTVNSQVQAVAFVEHGIDALITDDPLACAGYLTAREEERLETVR
jgi:glycerophosphoryl diester phosphodiesterase